MSRPKNQVKHLIFHSVQYNAPRKLRIQRKHLLQEMIDSFFSSIWERDDEIVQSPDNSNYMLFYIDHYSNGKSS